ncbi:hypothetical protein SAMN05216490_3682 [Mucilaginibacter mallensis]|uniref:YcxB-like protein n=1 Tax=Mucilaginibacter mallensis TaxID=652787 RepID=A0A1H2AS83_MUCMA|nr:YcxB family protein [Mucilaginibacter mallensis]SDT48669.1 hypothetical protein SAMN05216490_3682 [Mucilaginibacter mallensis]
MNPITFSTKLDYKTYMKLNLQRSYQGRRSWQGTIIWLFVITFGFATYNNFKTSHEITDLIIFSAFVLVLFIRPYINAKNMYKSTPNIGEEMFWKIDETGVEIKSKSSLTWRGWDSITKFSENKQWFSIWFNDTQSTYFPKSAVSEKELYEIKKLMFVNGKKGL